MTFADNLWDRLGSTCPTIGMHILTVSSTDILSYSRMETRSLTSSDDSLHTDGDVMTSSTMGHQYLDVERYNDARGFWASQVLAINSSLVRTRLELFTTMDWKNRVAKSWV